MAQPLQGPDRPDECHASHTRQASNQAIDPRGLSWTRDKFRPRHRALSSREIESRQASFAPELHLDPGRTRRKRPARLQHRQETNPSDSGRLPHVVRERRRRIPLAGYRIAVSATCCRRHPIIDAAIARHEHPPTPRQGTAVDRFQSGRRMPLRRNTALQTCQRARAERSASSRSKSRVEANRVLTIFGSVSKAFQGSETASDFDIPDKDPSWRSINGIRGRLPVTLTTLEPTHVAKPVGTVPHAPSNRPTSASFCAHSALIHAWKRSRKAASLS